MSEAKPAVARMDLWVEERHFDVVSARFRVEKVLFSERTPYQSVEIVETSGFGRMLLNDGLVMLTERDEHIYHEMIAHVPLFLHPEPQSVLVIGGGDGGTVREVLRHSGVCECHLVEIDEAVIRGCKEFIPKTASALDDPRVTVRVADGVEYVATTSEKYDLVIVDSTDPIGPAAPLFGNDFYQNVARVLKDNGIVISQAESPYYNTEMQKTLLGILNQHFERVHIYNYTNMTYPGALWSFSFASKGICPLANFDASRVRDANLAFSYYNQAMHLAAFALPQASARELASVLTPFQTTN